MKLLQVGCGKMGGAMLRRWADQTSYDIEVVDPSAQGLPSRIRVHRPGQDLPNTHYDALIVGIKPQMIDDVLGPYAAKLKPASLVFSMAAGASCIRLAKVLQQEAIVRIMPNLPALIGQSMSGLYATPKVLAPQKTLAQELAAAIGAYLWVDSEDQIDRFTAVAGSGPGYVFEILREYVQAATELGFSPSQARELVLHTVLGATNMALGSERSLEQLRESVTSKGGTTQAGLQALRADQKLADLLKTCTQAAYARAQELR